MNFIVSVLIAEAGEENGFYTMIYLLLEHELKTLFLPVSFNFVECVDVVGFSRVTLKKFLDGITSEISHAETFQPFQKNSDDNRLLQHKVVHDNLFWCTPVRIDASDL